MHDLAPLLTANSRTTRRAATTPWRALARVAVFAFALGSLSCVDAPGPTPAPRSNAPASLVTTTPPTPSPAGVDPAPTASAAAGPARAPSAERDEAGPWPREVLTWRYDATPAGPMSVVVATPATAERLPVLIALHGLGEAQKGVERGARGWIDDYGLLTAVERLGAPPLTTDDMQRLGTRAHLDAVNTELSAHPYRGLVLVCPYTPDILTGDRSLDAAQAFGAWLVETLLPRVYGETPALGTAASTGIDGVSLGGRVALLVGLAQPDQFGAVGSLQAAIYPPDIGPLAERFAAARAKNPTLSFRLLTSSNDFYRPTLKTLSDRLSKDGLAHDFLMIANAPHSYAFNRGPGVYAMLTYHDRALRP